MGWFGKKKATGPDYASVKSVSDVSKLVSLGELVPMQLLPEEFGGEAVAENTVYVPAFVADLKHDFDHNIVIPSAAEGRITRYSAQPEYAGRSMVPVAIQIAATEPAELVYDIAIWGAALNRS